MTRLDDLIISLATILVCYHDSQKINPCITETDPSKNKSREFAMTLLTTVDYENKIDQLNKECTVGYKGRLPFLDFIKDKITTLKTKQAREKPFDANELELYTNDIARLFIDFRELLKITKSKNHDMRSAKISLPGLIDDSSFTSISSSLTSFLSSDKKVILCNSGTLTTEILLDRFNVKATSSNEEMQQIAKILCQEHQDSLLAKENQKIKAELEQFQHRIAEQQQVIEALEQKSIEQQSAIEALKQKTAEQQSMLKALEDKNIEQQSTIEALNNTNATQGDRIKSLERQLAEQQSVKDQLLSEEMDQEPPKVQSSASKSDKEKALPTAPLYTGGILGLTGQILSQPPKSWPHSGLYGMFRASTSAHPPMMFSYKPPSLGNANDGDE